MNKNGFVNCEEDKSFFYACSRCDKMSIIDSKKYF